MSMHNFIVALRETLLGYTEYDKLQEALEEIKKANKIFIVGNGGSSAIASHVAEDFTKLAKIPMFTFNNAAFITCYANDYGWDHWIAEAIKAYSFSKGDLGIFISSSGMSMNIINGCEQAKKIGIQTVTFTGFSKNNVLGATGDINIWVDNNVYNIVEIVHESLLLGICDTIAKEK